MSIYSIWLAPKEPEYSKFQNLIIDLGEKYLTPTFSPHVTLLGAIEGSYDTVSNKFKKIIKERPNQIELDLLDISYEELWHRALYTRAQKTPQILDLFSKALDTFEYNQQDYMPHLSLIYGTLPQDIKSEIKQEIHNSYPKKIIIESADLYETEVGLEFVSDWKKLDSIKLV